MTEPGDQSCPRCGAARTPDQEYCLECGLRLPPTSGRGARLRRTWVRRVGWYPGDWVWMTLLALVVAAAGAAAAIATTHRPTSNTGTTFVYTSPSVPVTSPPPAPPTTTAKTTLPTAPEPTTSARTATKATTTTAAPRNGKTPWPAGTTGWTVVLVSLPATPAGSERAQAQTKRAVRAGLPEVGVLQSAKYTSLHPGYLVVFSGVYDQRSQAESTLSAAQSGGFPGAYARQIVP